MKLPTFGKVSVQDVPAGMTLLAYIGSLIIALICGCATTHVESMAPIYPGTAATNRVISETPLAMFECKRAGLWEAPMAESPLLAPSRSITVSPDSRHVLWFAREGGKLVVVVDGKTHGPYDRMHFAQESFTPDSQHWACLGKRRDRYYALVDGTERELPEFSEVVGWHCLCLSPDGKRLAYPAKKEGKNCWVIDGQQGPGYKLASGIQFSPDSRHFYYVAVVEGREVLLRDHEEVRAYGFVEGIQFPANGTSPALLIGEGKRPHERVASAAWGMTEAILGVTAELATGFPTQGGRSPAYLADQAKRYVAFHQHEGRRYDAIDGLAFSPDGGHLAYKAIRDKQCFVVLDDQEQQAFDFLLPNPLIFSGDSQHLAYVGGRGDRLLMVVDGKESPLPLAGKVDWPVFGEKFRKIVAPRQRREVGVVDGPVLSMDGRHVAMVVRDHSTLALILDGKMGKPYFGDRAVLWRATSPVSLQFSPDGNHVAYWAQGANYEWKFVVVDGTEGKLWHQILGRIVFDGNDHIHYLATDGVVLFPGPNQVFLVEEKVPIRNQPGKADTTSH